MRLRRPPREIGIALAAGALAACGFEPLHLWPLTLAGIAVLAALVAQAPHWQAAAWRGWTFGVGHFCVGNAWIATAFTYQANMPAFLGWIAVLLLSLYLAVYPALAAMAAWLARARPLALVLALAGAWIVSEWLRGWVFTGFPWNPLGVALLGEDSSQGLAGLATGIGTYGLSGVAVLLAGLCWLAVRLALTGQGRLGGLVAVGVAVIVLPAMLLQGPGPSRRSALPYTLVQPNIAQEHIDDPARYEAQFAEIAALASPIRPGVRRLVLWPESGVPDYLRDGYPLAAYLGTTYLGDPRAARARIARAVGPGSALLTGAVDLSIRGNQVTGVHNVVTVLDDAGAIRASYAKAHLVPYGEYLPMRSVLEPIGLSRLVPGSVDFVPGPGPRTLDLGPWGKAGVQICYEIVFSGRVVDRAHRPDYLFNPSNDGWFGAWGPPQHLAQARLRALEEGLPLLRATTNGISAVIDAEGIVRAAVPRHVAGRLDGLVPAALPPTLFALHGNVLPLGLAVLLIAAALLVLRPRRR